MRRTFGVPAGLGHAQEFDVQNPYTGEDIASVGAVDASAIDAILARAERGRRMAGALRRSERASILDGCARLIEEQAVSFAELIVSEAGKTIGRSRKEVDRAVNTLSLSAAEVRRNAGEVIPFDSYRGSGAREGWFTREPLGIVAAITPFNDPLNLVAHKVGPAVAGGNSVILKPSIYTPLSAMRLIDALIEAGLPEEIVTVANGGRDLSEAIVAARDVRMVSFTGGFTTGEAISRAAGLKKLTMELGGNSAVIVMADADLDMAVRSCVDGSFSSAGQNCIGVQRILVEEQVYSEFRRSFVARARLQRVGDPRDVNTDVGPMITQEAAVGAQQMVDRAVADGAIVLVGNELRGSLYSPTVLERVPESCEVWREEAFAPIVVLQPFDSFEDAVEQANALDYNLHAGIFTASLEHAMTAARQLEAGGVMVNDSSDYRLDSMPFGGFKYGSMGREGVRFSFEEMTQPKVVCIR